MFRFLKFYFGLWKVEKCEIPHLAGHNSFGYAKINDKYGLLKEIIRIVPDGSIWSISGFYSTEMYAIINPYILEDEVYEMKERVLPKQGSFKIQLNESSKNILVSKMNSWYFDGEIIEQHIYKGEISYLNSYDCLHEACTWISNDLKEEIRNIDELIDMRIW